MKDEKQSITDISIHIAALSASFKPAPDARHTTHWFTTDEVFDAIRRIDPGFKSPRTKSIKPCTMPAISTRTVPDPPA